MADTGQRHFPENSFLVPVCRPVQTNPMPRSIGATKPWPGMSRVLRRRGQEKSNQNESVHDDDSSGMAQGYFIMEYSVGSSQMRSTFSTILPSFSESA